MPSLHFRLPGRGAPLGHWLAWLLPEVDRATRKRWVEDSRVRIEGRIADRPGLDCAAGARVEIGDLSEQTLAVLSSISTRQLGSHSRWVGLIDEPPWPGGLLRMEGKPDYSFSIGARRDGLATVELEGPECWAESICALLADAGMPLVGDLRRGGLGAAGGVRLMGRDAGDASGGSEGFELDRLVEPAWRDAVTATAADSRDPKSGHGAAAAADLPMLRVSDETSRAIEAGHPWVLADSASDSASRFRPGSMLRVVSREGRALGWALAEGQGRPAARVWALGSGDLRESPSIEARVSRALARRRDLLTPTAERKTTAYRLIHGEGDELPGLFVDRLGPLLRVLVTGRASDGIRDRAITALRAQLPITPEGEAWSILELLHLPGSGASRFDRVRWISGGPDQLAEQNVGLDAIGLQVEERGLVFAVDPGWATPRRVRPGYGLFVDQRDNRARLEKIAARGGSWLNLFAHTGAFSASLLAAGAGRVTSVDLSAAYLERLDRNLQLNRAGGIDAGRHESVRGDGRRFLETLDSGARFSGIVLDPPTAAAAGRRFWSLARDLEPLLRRCVDRLEDAGSLLVTQNRSGPPLGIDRILERAATRNHRAISRLESAPAGADHPSRAEFPEGDPFEGWLLELA
jgi:23S rRNA (cytosine1962-C5)-methyltransferase